MIKRFIFILGVLALFNLNPQESFASYTYTMDNDDSNYPSRNVTTGDWFYRTDSASYRGDYRKSSEYYDSYSYYGWLDYQNSYTGFWGFYVYLNNYQFDNPSTDYYKCVTSSCGKMRSINQDTAPGGWNYIEDVWSTKSAGYEYRVYSRADSFATTGADAMRMISN
jgi:hypothetical protein